MSTAFLQVEHFLPQIFLRLDPRLLPHFHLQTVARSPCLLLALQGVVCNWLLVQRALSTHLFPSLEFCTTTPLSWRAQSTIINSSPVSLSHTFVYNIFYLLSPSNSLLISTYFWYFSPFFFISCLTNRHFMFDIAIYYIAMYIAIYIHKGKWSQVFINDTNIKESL